MSEAGTKFPHIGTNTPEPKSSDYLAHARLLLGLGGGYPCVSLQPDRFEDPAVAEEYVSLIKTRFPK